MTKRPDVLKTNAGLKDFQRRSVECVFRRLYTDTDQVDRFLLADEVGLGKTLVARGVTAYAVDYLWDRVDRIDVVYICSNADIARQNIKRLKLVGQDDFSFASRLTLLPLHTGDLAKRKLNFVSFTPATSFDLGNRAGMMEERALLYYLLEGPWALSGAAPRNLFQVGAGDERWPVYLDEFRNERVPEIDPQLAAAFVDDVNQEPTLHERFCELAELFRRKRARVPKEIRRARNRLIGDVRRLLARCCVRQLQPDLVILDEFQRFRHLLHGEDEAAQIAQELFRFRGHLGDRARVLMLSATPYKMLTLAGESEDDHYRDFLETARFLLPSDSETEDLERELKKYRAALYLGADATEALTASRGAVERRLRKVMCRTERLAVSDDRDGMLREVVIPAAPFKSADAEAFTWIDRISTAVGAQNNIELWKSGAYLLNFMDEYDLKRKVRSAISAGTTDLSNSLQSDAAALFSSEAARQYEAIDLGNAKLRGLFEESVGKGGWKLLWMPASLPYYAPGGAFADPDLCGFTKALVFSSWQLVPKTIAVLGSYEAERRMVRHGDPLIRSDELSQRQQPLLRFSQDGPRLTGMPLLTMLYPCVTLALEIDPLELGRSLENGTIPAESSAVLSAAGVKLRELLQPFLSQAPHEGAPDERWYWAALLLLDRAHAPGMLRWLQADGEGCWENPVDDGDTHFSQHVDMATEFFDDPRDLGRPPADLVEVIAKIAIASPAIVALRALGRHWPERLRALFRQPQSANDGEPVPLSPLLSAAAWIAMGFRTCFNRPETILLLRDANRAEPYWRRVLDYCLDGNLQAVIDEFMHLLTESGGVETAEKDVGQDIADRIHEAVALRTITLGHDEFSFESGRTSLRQARLRCRYALRFGMGEPDEGGEATREDQVRNAFNSPFRPFILASTSVGQEGLDFHLYCRAVYHWNLPSNPVDLEQREGRVHRYKAHVIRQNLAAKHDLADTIGTRDPWSALFATAAAQEAGGNEMIPYWVFEGPWKIERRIPLFPLSRDVSRLNELKRSLAIYRLVFGQPRQEELLHFLGTRDAASTPDALLEYRIDLAPRVPGLLQ